MTRTDAILAHVADSPALHAIHLDEAGEHAWLVSLSSLPAPRVEAIRGMLGRRALHFVDRIPLRASGQVDEDSLRAACVRPFVSPDALPVSAPRDGLEPANPEVEPAEHAGSSAQPEAAAGDFDAVRRRLDRGLGNHQTVPPWFHRWTWVPIGPARDRRSAESIAVVGSSSKADTFMALRPGLRRLGSVADLVQDDAAVAVIFADPGPDERDLIVHLLGLLRELAARPRRLRLAVVLPRDLQYEAPGAAALTHSSRRGIVRGLLRAANRELTGLDARFVELSDPPSSRGTTLELRTLLESLESPHAEPELYLEGDLRMAPRLEQAEPDVSETRAGLLAPGQRLLVTGGLGGIGRQVARGLLRHYDARLILVGRRDPADDPELAGALRELQTLGTVHYRAADIRDEGRVAAIIEASEALLGGPLDGAMHLAGSFPARLLADETVEGFEAVVAPKTQGTRVLHRHLPPAAYLAVFGSVAGHFGVAAGAAYSAANSGVRTLCEAIASVRPCVTIGWSNWRDTGLSRGHVEDRDNGFLMIDPEPGFLSLCACLEAGWLDPLVGLDPNEASVRAMSLGAARPPAAEPIPGPADVRVMATKRSLARMASTSMPSASAHSESSPTRSPRVSPLATTSTSAVGRGRA